MNNQYEIKFDQAEAAKELVGKTLIAKGGKLVLVEKWEGQNYTVKVGDKKAGYPVVVILDQIRRGLMSIAK